MLLLKGRYPSLFFLCIFLLISSCSRSSNQMEFSFLNQPDFIMFSQIEGMVGGRPGRLTSYFVNSEGDLQVRTETTTGKIEFFKQLKNENALSLYNKIKGSVNFQKLKSVIVESERQKKAQDATLLTEFYPRKLLMRLRLGEEYLLGSAPMESESDVEVTLSEIRKQFDAQDHRLAKRGSYIRAERLLGRDSFDFQLSPKQLSNAQPLRDAVINEGMAIPIDGEALIVSQNGKLLFAIDRSGIIKLGPYIYLVTLLKYEE